MLFEPRHGLPDFELSVTRFNHDVIENSRIQQTFNVVNRLFREGRPQLIGEAAAIHRKNFDEVTFVG